MLYDIILLALQQYLALYHLWCVELVY